MRVTLKSINDRLAELGHKASLEKGASYFYLSGGEATDWLDRTVKVPILSGLTLDQWVEALAVLHYFFGQLFTRLLASTLPSPFARFQAAPAE